MDNLNVVPSPVLLIALAVLCLMVSLRLIHLFLSQTCAGVQQRAARVVFDLFVGLTYGFWASACAHAIAVQRATQDIRFWMTSISSETLTPFAFIALGAALVVLTRDRTPWMLLESAVLVIASPPVLAWLGRFSSTIPLIVIFTAWTFCLLCTSFLLYKDRRALTSTISWISVTEALARMPAGILAVEDTGAVRLMNDAMRNELEWFGLPGELGDMRGGMRGAPSSIPFFAGEETERIVTVGDQSRLLIEHHTRIAGKESRMILSIDVTEEQRLNRELEETNGELEIAGQKLREQLASVDQIAREESLARARSRLHDIIGQRLSILHRYLEDGPVSQDSLTKMTPLLTSILEDLSSDTEVELRAELDGVASAFALVNVESEIEGNLPNDPDVSSAFVAIVREAVTNGVSHGQANHVRVALDDGDDAWHLRIENNGIPPQQPVESGSGTGIKAMRSLVLSLGGRFVIASLDPFVVTVDVPKRAPEDANIDGTHAEAADTGAETDDRDADAAATVRAPDKAVV